MSEVDCRPLNPVESAVISLLASALFGAENPTIAGVDPNLILKEAEEQAVFPLVYHALSQDPSVQIDPNWIARYQMHLANNIAVISRHYLAHTLMTEAGIPYTVIKGCASGRYYPVPEMRTMGDVDLYVGRQSMKAVRAFLTEKGYLVSALDHSHHWTFTKGSVEFEVHWLPSGVPAEDDGRIESMFDDLLDKRVLVGSGDAAYYIPDSFHHGLILLLHTANHLSAGGIGLRHLMDWVLFVSDIPERDFCERFEDVLHQLGLWQFAKVLTAVGIRFFGASPKAFCADISPELAQGILADILAGGNFGHKDRTRLMEAKLFRDEKTREVDGKSRLRHMIRFLNRKAQLALPITRKVPVLLPLGWMKVIWTKFIKKLAKRKTGSRSDRVRLRRLAQGAKERERLYKQLRLYEK